MTVRVCVTKSVTYSGYKILSEERRNEKERERRERESEKYLSWKTTPPIILIFAVRLPTKSERSEPSKFRGFSFFGVSD